jgi:hypothetical protein
VPLPLDVPLFTVALKEKAYSSPEKRNEPEPVAEEAKAAAFADDCCMFKARGISRSIPRIVKTVLVLIDSPT